MSDPLWCVWSMNEVCYSTPLHGPLHHYTIYVMLFFLQMTNRKPLSTDFSP